MLRLGKYRLCIFKCKTDEQAALKHCLERHPKRATTPSPLPISGNQAGYSMQLKCRDSELQQQLNWVKDNVKVTKVTQILVGYTTPPQRQTMKWAFLVYIVTLFGDSGITAWAQHMNVQISFDTLYQFVVLLPKAAVVAIFPSVTTVGKYLLVKN